MDRGQDDPLVRKAEEEAAAEAGEIGGRSGDMDLPESERPLIEAGEGESEGFDVAEHDLIEHATDQEGEGIPRLDQFDAEAEPDPGVYGEADEEESTD